MQVGADGLKRLNISENCLKVLEKRYLKKDEKGNVIETVEEMFRRVAHCIAEADRLYGATDEEVKNIEENFYDIMGNFEFMPNSPTLMNAGRDLGQLSACFAPDQIVITKSGPKQISEIKNGELVLTHKNRFREVTKVFVRKTNEIYILNAYKLPTETCKVTAEHPILAVKKGTGCDLAWIQIKDLSVGDYIAISFPKEVIDIKDIKIANFINNNENNKLIDINGVLYEKNTDVRRWIRKDGSVYVQNRNRSGEISQQVTPVKNKIEIDTDVMRLFGYYLSEGCVSDNNALRFVFSEKERDYCQDVLKIMKGKFGLSSHIEETNTPDRRWLSIRFHSKIVAGFFENLFGTGYESKKIPSWIMLLPIEKQKGLLAGMFRGDSCTFKNGNNFSTKLVMCNMNLVYAAWQLVMRAGHFAALNFESMPKLGRTLPVRCTVSGESGTRLMSGLLDTDIAHNGKSYIRTIVRGDALLTPITEIIKQPYQGEVYNLEVEEDHSYCANMIAVHNCFVLPVEDSMESIFEAVKNTALIHRSGGGTGFSFSRLRPKNSMVRSTGGISSGPVSFMKVFNAATQAVKQGGMRRGANMGILRVDHPDILEFIKCKESDKEITNFNISVALTEDFMKKVIDDEEYNLIDPHTKKITARLKAKEVFNLIVEMAWKNGEPGIVFIDRINKDNPTPSLGAIESTNPCGEQPILPFESCMAKDTRIATSQGIEPVEKLYERQNKGETIFIATQSETEIVFRQAKIVYTKKKPVFKVTLANGQSIRLTEDHKVLTPDGFKQVKGLVISKDKIVVQNRMAGELKFSINGKASRLYQMLGWFSGDGWFTKRKTFGLTFGPDDKYAFDTLIPIWQGFTESKTKVQIQKNFVRCVSFQKQAVRKKFLDLGFTPNKGPGKRVPYSVFSAPKELQIAYIQGLFCADGSAYPKKPQFYLSSSSLGLLQDVQVLLLNMGIYSNIKYYLIRPRGRHQGSLRIYGKGLVRFMDLINLPLSPIKKNRVLRQFEKTKHFYGAKDAVTVVSIKPDGIDDVYDVYEPVTHTLIAEGMIIHNCNLGSINLAKVVTEENGKKRVDWEKLKELVHLSVQFLDNVIDVNKFPLEKIEEMTKKNRKIGLGVMGLADMFIQLEIPYNSDEAVELAEKVMAFIDEEAKRRSEKIAEKKGSFPSFDDSVFPEKGIKRRRNATLTTVAPTGTISIISNTSSGIEPLFALSYFRNVMDNDKLVEVNPLFEDISKREGFYSRKLMEVVVEKGSIKDIDEVPEKYRKIFVTAHDIAPIWHIRMQAAFQKHTDNAVSKTVNFHVDAVKEDVREVYMLAYKLGCKGVTIYRDKSREEQVLNINSNSKNNNSITGNNPSTKEKSVAPRPRPIVTTGTTTKVATGCGNLYITINVDDRNMPFEVFIQMGKAGGCAASQLEAIGRLVSLALRSGVENKKIIEQLRGIRCPSPSWEKGGRIFSCADAIARVLELRLGNGKMHHKDEELERHSPHTMIEDKLGNVVGVCPDCGAALRHEEGCVVCRSCGYSKC